MSIGSFRYRALRREAGKRNSEVKEQVIAEARITCK
jgi:hypothetical protein